MGAIKAARTKHIGTRVEKKFGASLYKGVVTDVFGELETKQGLQRAYFYHIECAAASLNYSLWAHDDRHCAAHKRNSVEYFQLDCCAGIIANRYEDGDEEDVLWGELEAIRMKEDLFSTSSPGMPSLGTPASVGRSARRIKRPARFEGALIEWHRTRSDPTF